MNLVIKLNYVAEGAAEDAKTKHGEVTEIRRIYKRTTSPEVRTRKVTTSEKRLCLSEYFEKMIYDVEI